jgi:hypothetical protein
MRGGDLESGSMAGVTVNVVPSSNSSSSNGVVGSGGSGTSRGTGNVSTVGGRGSGVEMSGSGIMPRGVTSVTTRLLGSDVVTTNRSGSGAI